INTGSPSERVILTVLPLYGSTLKTVTIRYPSAGANSSKSSSSGSTVTDGLGAPDCPDVPEDAAPEEAAADAASPSAASFLFFLDAMTRLSFCSLTLASISASSSGLEER